MSETSTVRQSDSQEKRILHLLHASWPEWTPAPTLSRISLQYNARVFSLRRKGWQIETRVETRNGVRHGSFRLARPGSFPNPRNANAQQVQSISTHNNDSLFGDLTERHRDDG
jgi:hypothetical protein